MAIEMLDIEITDEDLRQAQEAWEIHFQQLKHPYVFDLIKVLAPYPRVKRSFALDRLHANRRALGLPIPSTFDESVARRRRSLVGHWVRAKGSGPSIS
jgi:hypothetical protein